MKSQHSLLCRREFLTIATQETAAVVASASMGSALAPLLAHAGEAVPRRAPRISYYCNGEIHVNEIGKPEGKPLTTGHMDFKPSWSKTGNMLVCFRRTKDDPVTVNWKSAISVINVDGTGLHQLSDGTHTDFNPTWTRDGLNTPIWNRKNDKTGGFYVMQSNVGNRPGQEVALTDETFHTWAHSCLMDGRILVNSLHPTLGWGVFLMSRKEGGKPPYERVQCELGSRGQLHRASISPSEKKICFEFLRGHSFTEPGHTLYIGDFDAQQHTITNLKVIANEEGKPLWYAYPRWIEGEAAVVYHMTGQTGKGQLYVYRLEDGSTRRVSANARADYRYPHGEAAPC
jgi:Tol biopolymer transport system component